MRGLGENKRELCSAEDKAVDSVTFFHFCGDRYERVSRFRSNHAVKELAHVYVVDEFPLFILGHDDSELSSRARLRIERCLHREPSSKQSESFEPTRRRGIRSCFDNADERNRGTRADCIEDNMRSVRRYESKVCASFREAIDFRNEKLGNVVELAGENEFNQGRSVDAVDENGRIASVRCAFPVRRDDAFVVLDCRFGSCAADDANFFHCDLGMAEKSTNPCSGSVDNSVALILSPTSSPCSPRTIL